MKKIFALTTVLLSALTFAGCGGGGGGGAASTPPPPGPVGPISSVNGFPTYYRDPAGLSLALCSNPLDLLCITTDVDPGNPYSVQIGFGDEAFYWHAESAPLTVPTSTACPTCGNASLVMGLEAAFAGAGTPAVGQQVTFSRLRILVDAPVVGTYTVTHPYGLVSFQVTTPGVRAINSNVGAPIVAGTDTTNGRIGDIGCLVGVGTPPCDFSIALNSGATFPFLVWDASGAAAPPGYIGSPLHLHTVTGSPTGNNVFRVQGPVGSNLGGPGNDMIETNLFAVSGKKY